MMHGITAVLLPCIVSGYALVGAHLIQVRLSDSPGSNLYFRVLLSGFFWLGLCAVAVFLVTGGERSWERFVPFFNKIFYGEYSYLFGYGASAAAIFLRWMDSMVFGLLTTKLPVRYFDGFIELFLQKRGKNMEIFLAKAVRDSLLVLFVLKNDKAYIALVNSVTMLKDTPEWLNLYPLASGHISKEDRKLTMTSNFEARKDTEMSVAVKEIVHMQFLK